MGAAKDLNPETIPANLILGGVRIDPRDVAGAFASHFAEKVKLNVARAHVNPNGVYNGKCTLHMKPLTTCFINITSIIHFGFNTSLVNL